MFRVCLVLVLALQVAAFAKPQNGAEAAKVMDQFLSGQMALNPALNRIQFLGEERYAAAETIFMLKRAAAGKMREQLLDFLGSLGLREREVESVLISALTSDETGEIILGARGLGRIKSGEAVKPLIGLLSHKLLGIRREAARSLGDIGRPAATAPLLKAAKVEGDLDVKILMITAAGRAGDKKQAPAFEAMLKDSSESTRLASAQALCSLGSPKCAQFAAKLFSSTDRNDRFQAVMLFEGSSSKVSSPQLMPMLKDPDDKIRARAARILVQGGDAARLEWLVIESAKAKGEVRLVYEDELEKLRLTDEQRQAILKKAGLQ